MFWHAALAIQWKISVLRCRSARLHVLVNILRRIAIIHSW